MPGTFPTQRGILRHTHRVQKGLWGFSVVLQKLVALDGGGVALRPLSTSPAVAAGTSTGSSDGRS